MLELNKWAIPNSNLCDGFSRFDPSSLWRDSLDTGRRRSSVQKPRVSLGFTALTDFSGRLIHIDFRSLPNKKKFPDYYTFTKLPIALDTLEAKLRRHEFPNLTAFESWFKRMVLNAKEYNEKGSQIYDDAERLRKGFSNYMTKVNPAYKVHGFVVTPVALPGEDNVDDEVEPEIEETVTSKRGKGRGTKAVAKSPSPPAWKVAKYAGKGFSGLTFQQAQEKVVEDMILFNDDPKFVHIT